MVRLAFAEALEQSGRRDDARRALAVALERLLARAQRIEDPAWCHRFLHAVPVNARILALADEWRASPIVAGPRPVDADPERRRAPTGSNELVRGA